MTSVIQRGSIKNVHVSLFLIENSDSKNVLYIIHDNYKLTTKAIPAVQEVKKVPEAIEIPKENFPSYDDLAPNPVFYFNKLGYITFSNPKALELNDPSEHHKNVNSLFLDCDLGDMTTTIQNYPSKEKEVIVRTVMKSMRGFIPGYARMSDFSELDKTKSYRLEYLISEDMQLVDKPLEEAMERLERSNKKATEVIELHNETYTGDFDLSNIITVSPNYKKVINQIIQVADTTTTVLITGETGTGKELLANLLFRMSDRQDNLMVKVNCAALPKELIESILFGHEKGSFTGADRLQIGKFELAHGGTLFLDEIGELPLDLQAKLLRALQEGEIERIGNPKAISVDVRVIIATNRNLEKMVAEGTFRSDLYYRICVFPIYNLPLRERKEDIIPLANYFLNKSNKRSGRTVQFIRKKDSQMLQQYNFPGNVRELENIIERSVVSSKTEAANLEFLKEYFDNKIETEHSYNLDDLVINHIKQVLKLKKGKVTGHNSASELLGIPGKTLASKLKKYNINPNQYRL